MACLLSLLAFIFQGALFILPSVPANMVPSIRQLDKLPVIGNWKTPVSTRLFGANKTWRGLTLGLLVTLPIAFALCALHVRGLLGNSYIPYSMFGLWSPYVLTLQMVGGTLGGDMAKSFLKRHLAHIPPGEPWNPWDRIDFLLGTYVVMAPYYIADISKLLPLALTLPILWFVVFHGQRLTNQIAVNKGIKKSL